MEKRGGGEKVASSMSGASAVAFETEYREIVPEHIQFKYKQRALKKETCERNQSDPLWETEVRSGDEGN